MSNVTLRHITPADGEFIYKVKKESFRHYVEKVSGWDEAEQRQLHERRFAVQEFRIIQLSDADVGYVAIMRFPDGIRLNQLFILPQHQCKGAGGACMQWVMQEAAQGGIPIRLGVFKINGPAQDFYRNLGFRDVGEDEEHVLMEWQP